MILSAAPARGPVLRDIHLPPAPPWWPPAPGWWVLAAMVVVLALLGAWLWRRERTITRRREHWFAELDRVQRQAVDAGATLAGIHQLLRRVARLHVPSAARQSGAAWRATLARVRVDAQVVERLAALDAAMYRPALATDADAARQAARLWLHAAARPRGWRRAVKEATRV
ncbi:MAG: DUF4381 family protein [Rhodanobacter sp.]|nr:MAG: DUF4381 family protein [Rhodanobacter sp.]TAM15085.1 MAG: DUF4381 family protein [Rhodanobacter sp.]TAM36445.1 MAG: DUF4381 family protein [Rhodanobacter sp.]